MHNNSKTKNIPLPIYSKFYTRKKVLIKYSYEEVGKPIVNSSDLDNIDTSVRPEGPAGRRFIDTFSDMNHARGLEKIPDVYHKIFIIYYANYHTETDLHFLKNYLWSKFKVKSIKIQYLPEIYYERKELAFAGKPLIVVDQKKKRNRK